MPTCIVRHFSGAGRTQENLTVVSWVCFFATFRRFCEERLCASDFWKIFSDAYLKKCLSRLPRFKKSADDGRIFEKFVLRALILRRIKRRKKVKSSVLSSENYQNEYHSLSIADERKVYFRIKQLCIRFYFSKGISHHLVLAALQILRRAGSSSANASSFVIGRAYPVMKHSGTKRISAFEFAASSILDSNVRTLFWISLFVDGACKIAVLKIVDLPLKDSLHSTDRFHPSNNFPPDHRCQILQTYCQSHSQADN